MRIKYFFRLFACLALGCSLLMGFGRNAASEEIILYESFPNSLTPGAPPYVGELGQHDDTDDKLVFNFTTPVTAAGFFAIDSVTASPTESVDFLDVNSNVIVSLPFPTHGMNAFVGVTLASGSPPIASIVINEDANDGDDVSYDDLVFGASDGIARTLADYHQFISVLANPTVVDFDTFTDGSSVPTGYTSDGAWTGFEFAGDEYVSSGVTFYSPVGARLSTVQSIFFEPQPPPSRYVIGYFDVSTRTYAGGSPETYFWFTVNDSEDYGFPPMESVVESATIIFPDGSRQTFTPDFTGWCHSEFRGNDNNRNGIIDLDQGEYEKFVNSDMEYEILSPVSPHTAGTYTLELLFKNGETATFSLTVSEGKSAVDWPPVTDLRAGFDPETGLLRVEWTLPGMEFPPDAWIDVRIEIFEQDGGQRYIRFRRSRFATATDYVDLFRWESDYIRLYSPYINVRVRVYSNQGINVAQSEVKEYAVNGYTLVPTEITAIDAPATLSDDLRTLYIPFLDYKGELLWMELTGWGPRFWKKHVARCLQHGNCPNWMLKGVKFRIKQFGSAR